MGQYYTVVNLDKQQYLHPHAFGDGLKLLEFGCSGCGTMTALAVLLADGNGRGGGDLQTDNEEYQEIIGSWAGDRIVVTGDYADEGKFVPEDYRPSEADVRSTLSNYADEQFEDISLKMMDILREDGYLKERLEGLPKSYISRYHPAGKED